MRIDRVKYTAHYDEFGVLKAQWIGLEGQIDDTEIPEKKLDEIKEITEQWYRKQNPQLQSSNIQYTPQSSVYPSNVITVERTSEDIRIAELIRDIYACTEIEGPNGLLTYNKLASTCKEAQQAFDIMYRKLAITKSYQNGSGINANH